MNDRRALPIDTTHLLPEGDAPRRLVRWMAAGLVCLLVVVMCARPVYRALKVRRARGVVREAQLLIEQGRWDAISRHVQLGLQLAPQDSSALRLAARYCTHFGSIDGMAYWQMLLASDRATRDDRLDYIRFAQLLGRLDLAGVELGKIMLPTLKDKDTLLLALQQVQQKNDSQAAGQAAQMLVSQFSGDVTARFRAGEAFLESADPAVRANGRLLLWTVTGQTGKHREAALRRLARVPELTPGEMQTLVRVLSSLDPPQVEHRLLTFDLRLRLKPDSKPELVAELIQGIDRKTPPMERLAVGQWLLRNEEAQAALDLFPFEESRQDSSLLQGHLQSLFELKKWDEIRMILKDSDLPLSPVIVHCFRGFSEKLTGNTESMATHFFGAVAECKNRPDLLLFVARYAEMAGAIPAAIQARQQMLTFPQLAIESAREIVRLSQQVDDLSPTLAALKRLVEFTPDDSVAVSELNYVEMVLNTRDPATPERVAKLFRDSPNFFPARLNLALWESKNGRAEVALDLLEGQKIDWDAAVPRARAIYTAVLGANHSRDAARRVARGVELDRLKPQERALVLPWLE